MLPFKPIPEYKIKDVSRGMIYPMGTREQFYSYCSWEEEYCRGVYGNANITPEERQRIDQIWLLDQYHSIIADALAFIPYQNYLNAVEALNEADFMDRVNKSYTEDLDYITRMIHKKIENAWMQDASRHLEFYRTLF